MSINATSIEAVVGANNLRAMGFNFVITDEDGEVICERELAIRVVAESVGIAKKIKARHRNDERA